MVIGIDHGNSQIKTVHTTFTSGITEHGVKPPMAEDLLEYKNKYYTLTSTRRTYIRDKTKDDVCFIMTLFAIAKEIQESAQYSPELINIDLAVGLPPEHYGSLNKSFAEYFKQFGDIITFKYNEIPYTISINEVFVFPQAFSAIAAHASDLKSYTRTYVVDIGGYTTDVLLLNKGKPDLAYCNSLELGIISMNNIIKHRVNSQYDIIIEDDHVYDVLFGRKTTLTEDIINFIKQEADAHANSILDKLRELNIELKANPVIFVGGGALLLQPFLQKSPKISVCEFIPEISANAVGYTILANGLLRKRSK